MSVLRLVLAAGLGLVLVVLVVVVSLIARRPTATVLQLEHAGRSLSFGPFVGYHLQRTDDPERITFVCRNEDQFYTTDLPAGAVLYHGEGLLRTLPDVGRDLPKDARITPLLLAQAPAAWAATRPQPQEAYRHFHSCYDAEGAVRTGFWLRHEAQAAFTYDMGGRVGPDSVLYHTVEPGLDTGFATLIEFDRGP